MTQNIRIIVNDYDITANYDVKSITNPSRKLNAPATFGFTLKDSLCSLYDTYVNKSDGTKWSDAQFLNVTVVDYSTGTYLFVGRISNLIFKSNELIVSCEGIGKKMDDQPIPQNLANFIFAEGKIKNMNYDNTSSSSEDFSGYTASSPPSSTYWDVLATGSGSVLIQNSGGSFSTKCADLYIGSGTGISRMLSKSTLFQSLEYDGSYIQWEWESTDVTDKWLVDIMDNSYNEILIVAFDADKLKYSTNGGVNYTEIQSVADNTKYTIKVVFFPSTDKFSIYVDSVLKVNEASCSSYSNIRYFAALNFNNDYNSHLYIDNISFVSDDSDYTVELCHSDDDETAFTWNTNEFVTGVDRAILINDTTDEVEEIWDSETSLVANTFDSTSGDGDDTHTDDGEYCSLNRTSESSTYITDTADFKMTGDSIPTTNSILLLEVKWHIKHTTGSDTDNYMNDYIMLQIYNEHTSSWDNIPGSQISLFNFPSHDPKTDSSRGSYIISVNPEYYLHSSSGNYDYLQLRVYANTKLTATPSTTPVTNVDYLYSKITYQSGTHSPITSKIVENGASYVQCEDDLVAAGVSADDTFQIGASTTVILETIFQYIGLEIDIDTSFNHYLARNFKGMTPMEIINSICQLEDAYWFEVFSIDGSEIVVRKRTNFSSSGITITNADLDENGNLEIHREPNHYSSVRVLGNPLKGIDVIVSDPSIDCPQQKLVIDESINTQPDALDVATNLLSRYGNIRSSLLLHVLTNPHLLIPGYTVTLNLTNPTISTTLVIRRVDYAYSFPVGKKIAIIWVGLGESPAEEKTSSIIKKSLDESKRARLNQINPNTIIQSLDYNDLINKPTIGQFPIGFVYISVVSTNPATLLGYGTWTQIASGKMLIGQDSSDLNFDTAEETGGSKTQTLSSGNIPQLTTGAGSAHSHTIDSGGSHTHTFMEGTGTGGGNYVQSRPNYTNVNRNGINSGGSHTHTCQNESSHTHSVGNASPSSFSIMNPYFVVYIWKRTA